MATARSRSRSKPTARATTRMAAAPRGQKRAKVRSGPPDPADVLKKINALKKKPWMVDVDVYLQLPQSDPPFKLQTSLEMTSSNRIVFRNRGRPGFIIRFQLHTDLNPGYRFPPDPTQAVWSRKGNTCPDQYGVWDILLPYDVDSTGMNLLVYNENPKPAIGDFQFNLRVTKHGKFLDLDPGGSDKNGPSN